MNEEVFQAVGEALQRGGPAALVTIIRVVDVLSTEPGWRTDHPTGTSGPWPGLPAETESPELAGSASGTSTT